MSYSSPKALTRTAFNELADRSNNSKAKRISMKRALSSQMRYAFAVPGNLRIRKMYRYTLVFILLLCRDQRQPGGAGRDRRRARRRRERSAGEQPEQEPRDVNVYRVSSEILEERTFREGQLGRVAKQNRFLKHENSGCYEPVVLELKNGVGCCVLSRAYTTVPGPRIILAITADQKFRLNPKEDIYPKSVDLAGLGYEDAQRLFGKPKNGPDGAKTFVLMSATGTRDFREQHKYYLDTQFREGILQSYKISGDQIPVQKWTKVE